MLILVILILSLLQILIIFVFVHNISKSDKIHLLENSVFIYKMHINEINIKYRVYNYYFDNLVKAKKL